MGRWHKALLTMVMIGVCSTVVIAQDNKGQAASEPAPPRDISGVWTAAHGVAGTTGKEVAPMTAWGQEQFDANKPLFGPRSSPVAEGNDPMKVCDPLGFPRNTFYEMRATEFVQTPTKVVQLFQYQHVWREIWTDGRELPKNAGGDSPDAPDPRYYGYSVGKWEGDDTFVVDSTGFDEDTWLDEYGDPHSIDLHVNERYHRVDKDTMELTVTVTDPKAYTKPFVALPKLVFKLQPKMSLPEQLCVPSQALRYLKVLAEPAANAPAK